MKLKFEIKNMKNKEIEKHLSKKIKLGYVYFIYSSIVNKIYIGETENISRIEIYKSIIEEKNSKARISKYNFYSKYKSINLKLLEDLINNKNEFKIIYIETKYHKYLEKSYICYLYDNAYSLYNSKLYNNHKYDIKEIDMDIITTINIEKLDRLHFYNGIKIIDNNKKYTTQWRIYCENEGIPINWNSDVIWPLWNYIK